MRQHINFHMDKDSATLTDALKQLYDAQITLARIIEAHTSKNRVEGGVMLIGAKEVVDAIQRYHAKYGRLPEDYRHRFIEL